jgi:Spy/CpxP family protein refolding chaperone
MRRVLLLAFSAIIFISSSAQAQSNSVRRPHMTAEEFQTKQKEFIIHHAELTNEESAVFFPLYFELQSKKHEINGRAWKKVRSVRPHERTEEECNEMIDALADVKIECAMLEKEYLAKFKKILPAKKLMRVQMAENRFQREILKGIQQGNNKQ